MRNLSLRTRLVVGLIAVVALGLGVAELTTYYSVRAFMLKRVDDQVAAARGPAVSRLFIQDRFRDQPFVLGSSEGVELPVDPLTGEPNPGAGTVAVNADERGGARIIGRPSGAPQNFSASIPPGTYAEVRFEGEATRATSFGFDQVYPIPRLPADIRPAAGGTATFTTGAIGSSEQFRVSAVASGDGKALLVVAVPMTDFNKTMDRLKLVGIGVSVAVLGALALVAFWLVRLGLKPLGDFAAVASTISAGDLTQRVAVANPRSEIGRLGSSFNAMMADLEDAFAQREHSEQKLRRFLADASHELRTPLTSIRGYAELFGRGAGTRPDDLEMTMNRIAQQSERMGLIVDDLLLLARLDQDRPIVRERVDLTQLAQEVVAEARARHPERAIVLTAAETVEVVGDPDRIHQAMTNLLANALHHAPSPARVSMRVQGGAVATIEVRDTGPGVPATDREHVFEPFFRASSGRARKDGGSGLGLAIVKAITDAHSGEVTLDCPAEGGAAFTIRLPTGLAALRDDEAAVSQVEVRPKTLLTERRENQATL